MMLAADKLDEVELNRLPASSIVGALYHKLQTHSSAPEDGRNYRPKYVELIGIISKPLLLHLVGCLYSCIIKNTSIAIYNKTMQTLGIEVQM